MEGRQPVPGPLDPEGLRWPRLWIGTWSMGGEGFGPHDLGLSLRTLEEAYDAGIRHFDTAGFYAQGRSEELLKKAFSSIRKSVYISSKGGLWRQGRRVWHDASPEALKKALHQSLDRLGTDYLDLFQLHWPDPSVPLDESLDALRRFRDEGLIRFWGAGNLTASQVRRHIRPGERILHQVHFNPVHRQGLAVMRAGREERRCINCVYSPFEQGLLADPRHLKAALGKKDFRRRNPYFFRNDVRKWLHAFFEACAEAKVSAPGAILSWIMHHPESDAIVAGPRSPRQLHRITSWLHSLEDISPFEEIFSLLDQAP